MATLSPGAVTLTDWAKTRDPDGTTATVIDLLSQSNEILADMLWKEGNLPTGNRTTVSTGLPTSAWHIAYRGAQPSKARRAQVDETCGIMVARSNVDKHIAELNGDLNAFRLQESRMMLEGMNQSFATALFYGNTNINPEQFLGFAPRYSTTNPAVPISQNVIDAGGTGADLTSVYLVGWGEDTVTGIYPKGKQAGLSHQDLKEIDATDENGNIYRAYADIFNWNVGLSVRDWRYAVRIANIDISDLQAQTGTQAPTAATALMKLMILAMNRIPNMGASRPVFYANRQVKGMLAIAALDKSQNALGITPAVQQFGNVGPGTVNNGGTNFLGVPIRTVDALLSTETQVTTSS